MTALGIEVKNLTKSYNSRRVVDSVSFEIEQGTIFALLGQNGAGKTTSLDCMTMTREYPEGDVVISGYNIRENPERIRPIIGVLPQDFHAYANLTARENIQYFANLYNTSNHGICSRLLDIMKLQDRSSQLYRKLSSGERRKVNIAIALW